MVAKRNARRAPTSSLNQNQSFRCRLLSGSLWISAFVDVESEVAVDAEVEVGADFPFVHHADGWSDPLACVIYTTCLLLGTVDSAIMRSCILLLARVHFC